MIGVSHWAYDKASVARRMATGNTEDKFIQSWNKILSEKLHVNLTLKGAFIDSWAKQDFSLDDKDQQDAFNRETGKLWSFANSNELFKFRTVKDVLEENQKLKDTVKYLNETLTNDINEMKSNIEQNMQRINQTSGEVGKNSGKLNDLSTKVGHNSVSFDNLSRDVGSNSHQVYDKYIEIADLSKGVGSNSGKLHDLSTEVGHNSKKGSIYFTAYR